MNLVLVGVSPRVVSRQRRLPGRRHSSQFESGETWYRDIDAGWLSGGGGELALLNQCGRRMRRRMAMARWLCVLGVVLTAGSAAPAPESFVELEPKNTYELQTVPLGVSGQLWETPVLVDKQTGERVYDWVWRHRHGGGLGLPSGVTTAPLGDSILEGQNNELPCHAMDARGNVWGVFISMHEVLGVVRYRSPYEPRSFAVRADLPTPYPDAAAQFRAGLRRLAQLGMSGRGLDAPFLLSAEAVEGLNQFDVGPGEADFPTPMEQRLAVAEELWKSAAEILNDGWLRWAEPPYIADYGCIYSPGNVLSPGAQAMVLSLTWRDVELPPQVRNRIAAIKDMAEGPERQRIRREANRLLLDYLVPPVGVASIVTGVAVPKTLVDPRSEAMEMLFDERGFRFEIGTDQNGARFDGVSLWYKSEKYGGRYEGCVCAVRTDGTVAWQLKN